MMIRRLLACVGLLFAYSSALTAAPIDDGMTAYQRKDYSRAFPLLLSEAEKGNSKAQYAVGRMYEAGFGTNQDYVKAAAWYRSAAEQGDAQAQHALSAMYAVGWGVPADQQEAVTWLRLSARQDYYYSQNDLASRYASGRGVPQDYVRAYMWFDLGASSAPPSVAHVMMQARDDLAKKMTAEQVARAKLLTTKCRRMNLAECD